MYSKRNLAYILTALEAIEKIAIYTTGFESPEQFLWANNQMNFNATYNLLYVIGEEVKKIDTDLKNEFGQIPWRDITLFRNRLAHDYRGTDPEVLFEVIKLHLQPLKQALVSMILRLDVSRDLLHRIVSTKHYENLNYLIK